MLIIVIVVALAGFKTNIKAISQVYYKGNGYANNWFWFC